MRAGQGASARHRRSTTTDPRACVDGADLSCSARPGNLRRDRPRHRTGAAAGAIVTDVGSAKECVIVDVGPHLPEGVHFVPGHPIAGTEYSGPEAGFAELFEGRFCILTPPPGADPAAVEQVAALWRHAGMTVQTMSARHHDRVLAITSHLPHLIAYTIVGTATDLADEASPR